MNKKVWIVELELDGERKVKKFEKWEDAFRYFRELDKKLLRRYRFKSWRVRLLPEEKEVPIKFLEIVFLAFCLSFLAFCLSIFTALGLEIFFNIGFFENFMYVSFLFVTGFFAILIWNFYDEVETSEKW